MIYKKENPNGKKNTRFLAWVRAHKEQLLLSGISISTIILFMFVTKNKDVINELWDSLRTAIQKGNLYSSKWFEKATNAELASEREKVRQAYCVSGNDFQSACCLQNLLWRFDKEIRKRAWGSESIHAPSIHREHGWYLPNDD